MYDIYELDRMEEKALKEVVKLADKSDTTLVDIEAATKAVKLIKKIEEVKQLCSEGMMDDMYAYDGGYSYMNGNSRTPRMTRTRGYRTQGTTNAYRNGSYSRHDERETMLDKLEDMMANSNNEQVRKIISESIERINHMDR